MAVSVLKRRTSGLGWSPLLEGTDQALIPEIEGSVATRNLWSDNAAVQINVGAGTGLTGANLFTGANVAAVQIGVGATTVTIPGNLTIQGTTTTVSTTNLIVSDALIYGNSGGLDPSFCGMAWDQGASLDVIQVWNPTNTRMEFGRFNTTGGTTVPAAALTTLVDLRAQNLSLSGSPFGAVSADAALRLAGTTGVLFRVGAVDRWVIDSSTFSFSPNASTTQDIGRNAAASKIQDIWMNRNIEIGVQNGTSRIRGFAGAGAVLGCDLIVEGGAGGTTASGRLARLIGGAAGSNVASAGGAAQVLGGNSAIAAQPAGDVEVSGGLASGGGGALGGQLTLQGRVINVNTIAGAAVTQRWTFTSAGHLQTVTGETLDIGEATQTNSPRTVYAATSMVVGTSVTTTASAITHSGATGFVITKSGSGTLVIDGGANSNNGVTIRAGSLPGGALGNGGITLVQGGTAGGIGGNGGQVQLQGGPSRGAAFTGGEILLSAGQSDTVAGSLAGKVRIFGGSAIGASGTNGGNVEIDGGSSAGAINGQVIVGAQASTSAVVIGRAALTTISFRSQGAAAATNMHSSADAAGLVLTGFTATSIIGALNEANAAATTVDTLQATLGAGNVTGGSSILVTNGDRLDSATAVPLNLGTTTASQVVLGKTGIRVSFPTGAIVEGTARIKNGTAIVASDTADSGERMVYDPSGGTFTLSAPSSPVIGDRWGVKNRTSSVATITISGNGNNIEDPTSSFALAASFALGGDGISAEWEFDGTQWLVV